MYIHLIVPCDTWTVLMLHVVIHDRDDCNIRLLLLPLRSVNLGFELPTAFIFKYFINPSMEYFIPNWWPSVSKIVQKHHGTRFSHCSCHCKTVSNSVCLSEGATVTKGGWGLPIGVCHIISHVIMLWPLVCSSLHLFLLYINDRLLQEFLLFAAAL